jgi:two-component system CheB/CheR fusion protein
VIEGVVLTFTDISQRVAAGEEIREAKDFAESIVNTVREPLIVLDAELNVVSANPSFFRNFHVAREDTVGKPIYELGNRQWDIPGLRKLLETILPREQSFEGYEVEQEFPGIGRKRMLLNARKLISHTGKSHLILLAIEEVSAHNP